MKFAGFVSMFQYVTPGTGSTMRYYIRNIKAVGLSLSEKKNFEICLLCFYAPIYDPQGRTRHDPCGII